jgi:hypothetical protein
MHPALQSNFNVMMKRKYAIIMGHQIYCEKRLVCHEMNAKGAFHIYRKGFHDTVLIDADILPREKQRKVSPFARRHVTSYGIDQSGAIAQFRSPFSVRKMSPIVETDKIKVIHNVIYEFYDERWAALAIFAGIISPEHTGRDAFAIYDSKYAANSHESIAARKGAAPHLLESATA